jgi:hypothetical protein
LVGTIFSYPFLHYITPHSLLTGLASFNLLILVGVPLLSLLFLASRIFFGAQILIRWKTGLWVFWILNIVSLAMIATFSARQFSQGNNRLVSENDISRLDTLYIEAEKNPYEEAIFFMGDHFQLGEDQLIVNSVMVQIQEAPDDRFRIVQEHYSRGRNLDNAVQLANDINFEYRLQDNQLHFPNFISLDKGQKWRNQEVRLIIYVPEGKTIFLRRSAMDKGTLRRIDIDRSLEHPYPYYDRYWKMTEDGLICEDWINRTNEVHPLNFSNFDQLQVEGPLKVFLERGDNYQVRLTGRKKYVDRTEINQLGRTLSIIYGDDASMKLYITMPSLKSFDAENTEDVRINGFQEDELFLRFKGNEDLNAFLEVEKLTLVQEGRSKLTLRGSGNRLNATLKRNANLEADGFRVNTATIFTEQYSSAELMVSDTLKRKASDAGDIEFAGTPQIIELEEE